MSTPGWYHDPAGTPGQFRYWDGQAWSSTTTGDPRDPAPPSKAPVPGGPRKRRPGRLIVAGALALVIIIVGLFAINAAIDQRSDIVEPAPATTLPGGADTTEPSPSPPDTVPSGSTVTVGPPSVAPTADSTSAPGSSPPITRCPPGNPAVRQPPVTDNRVHGGNLSFPRQSNYSDDTGSGLIWAYDVGSQSRSVQPQWSSTLAVGALLTMDGFEEPKSAARLVMACTAPSALYPDVTSRTDLFSRALEVDGRPAWALRSEIRVQTAATTLPGDVVEVIVVDADSPESLSLFWACVPIGDAAALGQLDRVIKSLRVN